MMLGVIMMLGVPSIISGFLGANSKAFSGKDYSHIFAYSGIFSTLAVVALIYVYGIFITIALWRSAKKYEGPAIWAILVYIIIIFSILNAVRGLITGGNKDRHAKSIAEAMHENMHLPIMVGDGIELRRISGKDDNIYYFFILTNQSISNLNTKQFITSLTPTVKKKLCSEKETRALLDDKIKLTYVYLDNARQAIGYIDVVKKDCAEID
jgi:hypothetical protein